MKKFIVSMDSAGQLKKGELVEESVAEKWCRDLNVMYGAKTHIVVTETQFKNMQAGLMPKPIKIVNKNFIQSNQQNKKPVKSRWLDD